MLRAQAPTGWLAGQSQVPRHRSPLTTRPLDSSHPRPTTQLQQNGRRHRKRFPTMDSDPTRSEVTVMGAVAICPARYGGTSGCWPMLAGAGRCWLVLAGAGHGLRAGRGRAGRRTDGAGAAAT